MLRWHRESGVYLTGSCGSSKYIDAETALRGNTFIGDDSYLEPYDTAEEIIRIFVQDLRKLTTEDLHQ